MGPKNPLFQKCLAHLESLPNMQAVVQDEPYFAEGILADGLLTIDNGHKAVDYIYEIKAELTYESLDQVTKYFAELAHRLQPHQQRALLIANHLSDSVVKELFRRGIQFIDANGNIYLNSPEMYVVTRSQVPIGNRIRDREIDSKTLSVMYFLLEYWLSSQAVDIGKIAKGAGVSKKFVVDILEKLSDLGYCKKKEGSYEIVDFTKLLERWELGYSEQLRSKLFIESYSPIKEEQFLDVSNRILKARGQETGSMYLVGGELAASRKISHLRPIGATLHLQAGLDSNLLAVNLKLKPNPEGTIIFLQDDRHWDAVTSAEKKTLIASPLLIHTELVQSSDSRLRETAQMIYEEYIEKKVESHDRPQ
jgi:hypothetical protein